MTDNVDGLPIVVHLSTEFYAWLWWCSETRDGRFALGDDDVITLWVDDRIAFRSPNESKLSAVMTGDNPSTTLEARAALAGGKVIDDLRIGVRRDDREFFCTLKGPAMDLTGVRLPQVLSESQDEVVYDRMFLYDELCFVLATLFRAFAEERVGDDWAAEVHPALAAWVAGRAGAG